MKIFGLLRLATRRFRVEIRGPSIITDSVMPII